MANYDLVIDSTFQPFSFERYIQPYEIYGKAYKEQETALDTLSAQAETLRQRAMEEQQLGNVKWADRYLKYADAITQQADALSREGLTMNSRKALSSLKRQYGDVVAPVQKAIELQEKMAEKAASQSPALRMQYGALPSIDDLIADPTRKQIGYSGAAVEESAAKLAAAASSRNVSESFNAFKTYWMKQLQTQGYNKAAINEFLRDADKYPELKSIKDTVIDQFGGFEGLSPVQQEQMKAEIVSGILKGATYKETVDYKQNAIALKQWESAHKNDGISESGTSSGRGKRSGSGSTRTTKAKDRGVNPRSMFTLEEKNNFSKEQLRFDDMEKKGYIRKQADGSYVVTKKAIKDANSSTEVAIGMERPRTVWNHVDVRKFLTEIGAAKNGDIFTGYSPQKLRAHKRKLDTGYDTTRETEFVHMYGSSEEQNRAKNMLSAALGNGDATVVSYKKGRGYTADEAISKEDFANEDFKILGSKGSKYGQYFIAEDKEGKIYTLKVPEVNREQQKSVVRYYVAAEDAYKKMTEMEDNVAAITAKLAAGIPYEELSLTEQDILIDYYAHSDAYEDNLWEAEVAQGNITRGYTTDNIETDQ